MTSDAHEGLKGAIAAVLQGASWQRCRTHFMRNALALVPKAAQPMVAATIRTVFAQPDPSPRARRGGGWPTSFRARFPKLAQLLDDAEADVLAYLAFPPEHWRQLWSNNPLERLKSEVKRRTDVVGIFPNEPSIVRLVGAVLAEQHDEWQVGPPLLQRRVPGQRHPQGQHHQARGGCPRPHAGRGSVGSRPREPPPGNRRPKAHT